MTLPRPVRVVHCLEQMRSGGVERRRLSLARGLDPTLFKQAVICTEVSASLREQFEKAGCPVFAIGPMRHGVDWRQIRRAAQLLRELEPDIAHGAVFEGVILAVLGGRLARVPTIVAEETISPVGRRLGGHLYFRLLTGLADEVIAISQGVSDYLTKTIRLPHSKVRLIYNGVAEPQPSSVAKLESVRREFGLLPEMQLLGTVSRLAAPRGHAPDAHKRISDAIVAMKFIARNLPNARLMIVGDGPARPFLENKATREGVRDRVIFAGFQSNTRPFLEIIDVLLLPSETEGLPLVLVEAMLASKPVIATDVAGSNEVVVPGETGFLVPVGVPESLAEKATELLQDRELRASMGAAGCRRARSLFSEERYIREVATMYRDHLTRPTNCEPR